MPDHLLPREVDRLAYRIVQVPRVERSVEGDDTPAEPGARMLATVALAAAAAAPFVLAWVRRESHRRVEILTGGGPLAPPAGPPGARVEIPVPLGAAARTLAPGKGRAILEALAHWVRCEGRFDPLAADAGAEPLRGSSLEDLMALLADRPIGWLVVARPVARATAQTRLESLSSTIANLELQRDGAGEARLAIERAEQELRYLERWSALGFWELEVWAGGGNAVAAQAVAGMLSSSADLATLPVRLRPAGGPASPAAATEAPWSGPLLTTAEVVAALARPPERELAGLRTASTSTFDITPESAGPIELGQVLDTTLHPCGAFGVVPATLNRHVFVTGATGSGKSQTVRRILDRLAAERVPWMVVEPAKAEYARMAGRLAPLGAKVAVIRPGDNAQPPPRLNPLEPTSAVVDGRLVRFPLQTHVDLVRALFNASFEAMEPFPQILSAAITRCYEDLGWNLGLGRSLRCAPGVEPRHPTLADLQRTALDVVEGIGYGDEVKDNVRGFVDVRIGSLRLGGPGRFFESGHPLDLQCLIDTNAVFEIQDLGDDNDKAFLMGTVVIRLFELLRLTRTAVGESLRHMLVLEEAHRLLRRSEAGSVAARAVEMFADLLSEVRAYGEGIVVAEQIPAKIIPDVVKNSALKVMHRLPAVDDRDFVGATMNLSEEQSTVVVALRPGRAAVHAAGMDRPVLVDVDGSGRSREREPAAFAPVPIGCRSAACPERCAGEPCTLEAMEVASEIARHPELILWTEVTVVGHILGEPVSPPKLAWLRRMRTQGGKWRVRCALGQLVDEAVRRRSAGLQELYDPGQLARHVADALFAQLADGAMPCREEPEWQAGRFRWRHVARALKAQASSAERASRHPASDLWKRQGLVLEGGTWAEQLADVLRQEPRPRVPFDALVIGRPNRIDEAALAVLAAASPEERLRGALDAIGIGSAWANDLLGRQTLVQYPTRH